MHALMYAADAGTQPSAGFDDQLGGAPYIALVDYATSWAYIPGEGQLASSLSVSGFLGAFSPGFTMPACGTFERLHAKLVIGGLGLDGVRAATTRVLGEAQRVVTGSVAERRAPRPASTSTPSILRAGAYYCARRPTRPERSRCTCWRGRACGSTRCRAASRSRRRRSTAGAGADRDGRRRPHRRERDGERHAGAGARAGGAGGRAGAAGDPGEHGEPPLPGGRLHVAFATSGTVTLPVPPGSWQVIVARVRVRSCGSR